jgi:hypothetical protein
MTVVDGANVKSYDKVENNVYKHPGHEFEGVHVREGEDDLTFKAYSKLHKYNQLYQFTPNYRFFQNPVNYYAFNNDRYADHKETKSFVEYLVDRLGINLLDVIVNLDVCDTCIATLANLVKQFSYYDVETKSKIYDELAATDMDTVDGF